MMRRRWRWLLATLALLVVLGWVYVRTRPLVFMRTHRHCIVGAGVTLRQYADEHEGHFPSHPKGYPNALLLLMDEDCFHVFTGPGYEATPLREAKRMGEELAEEDCGRVYIQGGNRLAENANRERVPREDATPQTN